MASLWKKGSMKAKSPQPLQKRLASKQNMCSLWKKRFLKVAKTGMWQPLEKRLAEVFKLSRNSLKKRYCFSLGQATPLKKREPLEKRRLPPLSADLLKDHWCTSPGGPAKKGLGWARECEPPQMCLGNIHQFLLR